MALRFSCLFFVLLVLGACSISNGIVYEDKEGIVEDAYFKTVKSKTEKNWLYEHLGDPASIIPINETIPDAHKSHKIYNYRFTRSSYKNMRLLFVFRFTNSNYDQRFFHVMLCDDLVQKSWWDTFEEVEVARVVKRSRCKPKKNPKNLPLDRNIEHEEKPKPILKTNSTV